MAVCSYAPRISSEPTDTKKPDTTDSSEACIYWLLLLSYSLVYKLRSEWLTMITRQSQ